MHNIRCHLAACLLFALASSPQLHASTDNPSPGVIHLHAGAIDTAQPSVKARRQAVENFSGKRLHLVQWTEAVRPEWHTDLVKSGVQIIDYIPDNAYLVYGDVAALRSMQGKLAAKSHVRWEGSFRAEDKVHPDARPGKRLLSRSEPDLFAVQLVYDPAANAETLALIDALKLAPIVRQVKVSHYYNVIVRLPPDAIADLAAQADIISVWPYNTPKKRDERQGMIVSGNLTGNNPSGAGYLDWLASKGFNQAQFDASGLVVDVTDSGLDNGTTNVNHFALYVAGNTSSVPRVRYTRLEGTANAGSTLQGCDGHGNLNSHIIGGYVSLTNFPHTDSAGYRYGLGIAPFVKVGSSVIFDPANFTSPNYSDLASRAYRDGARVSGNSWGADTAGGYDVDAQEYDQLVRDSQPDTSAVPNAGNQELTFVFAAGNAGSGAQTVGSPGTAKNVITVGAAENVHSHATTNGGNNASGNDGCSTPDAEANSANDMATFSSRGPCADGRKKPEIVAPGTHVTGGVGQNVKTMAGNGTALTCFSGEGVCALPGGGTVGSTNNFFPLGQRWYSTSSGTSHSTPAVAGGAALVYQWFLNNSLNAPSPAMIKSFLMNAARYMNGTGANDALLSNNQGMGMMNLGTAFDGTPRLIRDQVTNETFTASGQTRTYTGVVVSNSKPFRVTLSWTDAPGATSGNAYKNNLNLVVTVNGQTYLGNVFTGSTSVVGGTADPRNNSESVFLPAGTTGAVAVTVSAANINSDGVPNFGGALDQDFALVVYNFDEVDTPVIVSAGSEITAESCGIGNGSLDPDEIVSINFALQNVGSADTTNVVATLLATGGVASPSSAQSYGALLAEGAIVTNTFSFTVDAPCGGSVTCSLSLADGATDLGTITYVFGVGGFSGVTGTNSNPSSITITDNSSATPYPSTINVSGVAGTVTKVTVTLAGLSHTYPEDMDILLVGPGGQSVALMGAVGGATPASGVTLTFDDEAAGQISEPITSGTYQPSGGIVSMPSPAPVAPYGSALSVFNEQSPNGTWSLYVVDAAAEDSGNISQGWRLNITAGEPLCCASNQPPILGAIGNKVVVQSNTLTFAVSATDPADGDPITLTMSNAPGDAILAATNGNGTFIWTNALPVGVYNTSFYATDVDGTDSETITITVTDGSCVGSNIMNQVFSAATVPTGWVDVGTANDTASTHYQSAPNCRALGASDSLTTLAVDYPTQIVFYVDASSGGNGQTATLDYSINGGAFAQVGSFVARETGSNITFALNATPNLSGSTSVRFRFNSSFNTWYLDDVRINGGCPPGPVEQTPPILAPIGAKSALVSNLLQFAVTATPTDGDTVTLSAENLPAGSEFGSTNEVGIFVWTAASPIGVYTSRFLAVDNDGTNSESVIITVSEQLPASTNPVVNYIFEDLGSAFTRAADSVLPGVTASLFESGDGASTNAAGNPIFAIMDTGFTGTGSNWFQFSLTIPDGTTVNVSRIKFDDRRSNTGPSTWAVRSSLDGFGSDLASGASHLSFTTNEETIAPGPLTGTVTFRIIGGGGTGGGTWRLDNVSLLGSEEPEAPDAPSITITTATQTVSNPTASIPVGGTANTNVIGEIIWTNSLTGGSGTIPASTSWLISSVALNVGANVITVSGTNGGGSSVSANVTITRQSGGGGDGGCSNIYFQGFESGDSWTVASGSAQITNSTGAADTPASQRILSGTNSWQVSNANRTLQLAQVSIGGFTGRTVTVRLSSTSGTIGNGADPADGVRVFVALDGAAFGSPDLVVQGNAGNNSRWGFNATNILTTTAGTTVSNAAPVAGTSSNAYATLRVNLPDSATSIALRVQAINNDSNERWNVDDIALSGCSAGGGPDLTPGLVITTANQTVSFATTSLSVGGTSTNLTGDIVWSNSFNGSAGSIAAATDWLISGVPLAVGTNAITVSGSNNLSVVTSAVVSIVRESNDTDMDGLLDQWELDNFGSLTNANATSDVDGDFVIDLHEFLSGTQPTNINSFLRVEDSAILPGSSVVIYWTGVNGKLYTLSRTTNLLSYLYSVVQSNIPGVEPLNVYTDPAPPEAGSNYRIELEQ
jgi:subtilisin-like proprotein convertase family protein